MWNSAPLVSVFLVYLRSDHFVFGELPLKTKVTKLKDSYSPTLHLHFHNVFIYCVDSKASHGPLWMVSVLRCQRKIHLNKSWQSEERKGWACVKAVLWWHLTQPLVSQILQLYNSMLRWRGWTLYSFACIFCTQPMAWGFFCFLNQYFSTPRRRSASIYLECCQLSVSVLPVASSAWLLPTHTHRSINSQKDITAHCFDLPGKIECNNDPSEMALWVRNLWTISKNLHSYEHLTYTLVNNRSVLLTGIYKVNTFNIQLKARGILFLNSVFS